MSRICFRSCLSMHNRLVSWAYPLLHHGILFHPVAMYSMHTTRLDASTHFSSPRSVRDFVLDGCFSHASYSWCVAGGLQPSFFRSPRCLPVMLLGWGCRTGYVRNPWSPKDKKKSKKRGPESVTDEKGLRDPER